MKKLKTPTKRTFRNQQEVIVDHLMRHGSITNLEAIGAHRIFNLKGRIEELRNHPKYNALLPKGKTIGGETRRDVTGKSYKVYFLEDAKPAEAAA